MIEYVNQNSLTDLNNLQKIMLQNWEQIGEYIGIKEWYVLNSISSTYNQNGIFVNLNNFDFGLTTEQKQKLQNENIIINYNGITFENILKNS